MKSVLNLLSAEAVATRLGPGAFLREILIALVLSLPLPLIWVIGERVWHQTPNSDRLGVAAGIIGATFLVGGPLTLYASLSLNAATVARERTVMGADKVRLDWAFQKPLRFRRSLVPGTTRSHILAGFPSCVSFGILFAHVSYAMTGSPWSVIHLFVAVFLAMQAMVVVSLMGEDAA